ncbi:MAG: sugar phosphate isomerase/epimerase [Chloroflexi bacterium]|nr:sugar phosphate isomerase/epimerase [Chloroflexota bacterium]
MKSSGPEPAHIEIGICLSPDRITNLAPGYDYVELAVSSALNPLQDDTAFADQMARLEALPLPVKAFNVFAPAQLKFVGPQVDWHQIDIYLQRATQRAAALGGEVIVVGSGGSRSVPEGFNRDRAWGQLIRFLNLAADHAGKRGLTIAIEPLNKQETNIINSYREAVRLAQDVHRREVKVLADIYHFQMEGEPLEDIREGAEWLAHVHLADSGRRHPGSGEYPLRELFALLRDIGYRGRASVECRWGDDFRAESAASLRFLRDLLG